MVKFTQKNVLAAIKDIREKAKNEASFHIYTWSLQAHSVVRRRTPFRTGRCRRAWGVSYKPNRTREPAHIAPYRQGQLIVYIYNSTPYIKDLNDGFSNQAEPYFIESTIQQVFVGAKFGRIVRYYKSTTEPSAGFRSTDVSIRN